MAHKRMFSKDITTSDSFREMPTSTQALYFHLGMEADDDGFLDSYKGLMRAVGAKDDDLKLLVAKRFILPRDNGIIVIKHWLINNTIRKDRYTETKHIEAKNGLFLKQNGAYTEDSDAGIPVGNHLATQKRIGKERIEEITADAGIEITDKEPEKPRTKKDTTYLQMFELWGKYPANWRVNKTEIQSAKNLLEERGLEDCAEALEYYQKHKDDPYIPTILKPSDLDRKWLNLETYYDKHHG